MSTRPIEHGRRVWRQGISFDGRWYWSAELYGRKHRVIIRPVGDDGEKVEVLDWMTEEKICIAELLKTEEEVCQKLQW